jgi:holo-[acyl-carrier protein] synthase
MMRIYQGVDIVDVARLKAVCLRHVRFAEEIFSERERNDCLSRRDPYVHFSGRFAAKEACLKALGRGLATLGSDHILQEIEVVSAASGRPQLLLRGWAEKLLRRRGIQQLSVSISHTRDFAVATVILVGRAH